MTCLLCIDSLLFPKNKKKEEWVMRNLSWSPIRYAELVPLISLLLLISEVPGKLYWLMTLVVSIILLELIPFKAFPLQGSTIVSLSSHFMGSGFPAFLVTLIAGIMLWCLISVMNIDHEDFIAIFTGCLLVVGPIIFGTGFVISRYFSE